MKSPIPQPNPYGGNHPQHQPPANNVKPLWKEKWTWVIVVVLALLVAFIGWVAYLAVTSDARAEENKLEAASIEASQQCTEAVADIAKYPAGVEFPEPIDITVIPSDPEQGPTSAPYYGLALGQVHFPNGFGVPHVYDFGCVSYHDADGSFMRTQADARKESIFSRFAYVPSRDELR
ncbi:hypothetical protein [Corynebacterium sp.]|uniref:hypothetical protein n=1 Tax=Corynebacterium sp. TaxID=1720 RepID=UPI0028A8F685|nr:hypothetical protein [Corynebacterium sp.]